MKFFNFFKKKQTLIPQYKDYPEQPYISSDRDIKVWLEQAETFPDQSFVKREMMIRNEDGILPGHVYMLYWLSKYINKEIPLYFEYKYGINFNEEVFYLIDLKLIDQDKNITNKGRKIIDKYKAIIEEHSDPDGQKRKLTNIVRNKEYKDINYYDAFELYKIGEELYKQGQYSESEKYLKASVKKNNEAPALYRRLAILYRKQKRYQDEINILEYGKKILQQSTGIYHDDAYDRIDQRIEKTKELLRKRG
ncbi:tetratricopeptide repeat protein [Bacillus sp. IITD106]|nr:tetratricopeptide repeat protein [Bacillus sp. IITD106]